MQFINFLIPSMIGLEIIMQYLLQRSVQSSIPKYLYFAMAVQLMITSIYYMVLKSGYNLAVANTLIDGGGAIGIVLLGYLVFNQTLNYIQLLSIATVIVAVMILGNA